MRPSTSTSTRLGFYKKVRVKTGLQVGGSAAAMPIYTKFLMCERFHRVTSHPCEARWHSTCLLHRDTRSGYEVGAWRGLYYVVHVIWLCWPCSAPLSGFKGVRICIGGYLNNKNGVLNKTIQVQSRLRRLFPKSGSVLSIFDRRRRCLCTRFLIFRRSLVLW